MKSSGASICPSSRWPSVKGHSRWWLGDFLFRCLSDFYHRRRHPSTVALREWALGIAARRGRFIAVVALARRLAGILYAMLRDGTRYEPACARRVLAAAVVPA